MAADEKPIDDYRVYVDPATKRVSLVFISGSAQVTANVNAADAQKIMDALSRAVEQLKGSEAKH